MRCPECGWENAEYVAYCGQCGADIKDSPTTKRVMTSATVPSPQTRSGWRVLGSLFTIIVLAFLLMRIAVFGGNVFDMLLLAIMATIVPYLVFRHRRNQDKRLSAHRLKPSVAKDDRDPLKGALNRNLVRIEGNWMRRCEGAHGRVARLFRRKRQVIGFGTEREQVALILNWDSSVSLTDGIDSRHDLDLDGPEEEMLILLENAKDTRITPSSIRVRMRERNSRPDIDYVVRDAAAKMLRILFK
jgi:hypothetical protein